MYLKIKDFLNDWKYESEATEKILRGLTDESLTKKFDDDIRSIGILAWHLVITFNEMLSQAQLKGIESPGKESAVPKSANEIADAYSKASRQINFIISKQWDDDSLTEEIPMYGRKWSKGKVLSVLVLHQAHHRGQLTVLMRMCGLKVPGVYGPAKEEWAYMNMPPME